MKASEESVEELPNVGLGRIWKHTTPLMTHAGPTPIPQETSLTGEIIDHGDQHANCDDNKHGYVILYFPNPSTY